MAFVRHNANPKNETNDCIIRSISHATGRHWQDVMKEMCSYATEMYLMPNDGRVVEEYMYNRNIFAYNVNEPMTVKEFAAQNPSGRFVVGVEDHALSIIDGDWYDLTDSADAKVLEYYKVQEGI